MPIVAKSWDDHELGLGNSIHVQAYRIASLVPGSLSLILADTLPWSWVFWITAVFMLVGVGLSLFASEPERDVVPASGLVETVVAPFRDYLQRRGWGALLLALTFMGGVQAGRQYGNGTLNALLFGSWVH